MKAMTYQVTRLRSSMAYGLCPPPSRSRRCRRRACGAHSAAAASARTATDPAAARQPYPSSMGTMIADAVAAPVTRPET